MHLTSPGSKSGDLEARELRAEMAFWPGFQRPGRGKASAEAEGRHNRLIDLQLSVSVGWASFTCQALC